MNSKNSNQQRMYVWVPVLALVVAALSLSLSIYLAYRDGQLANQYLALDLQEKRPFLAPVVYSRKTESSELSRWSWGARNTGTVITRLLFADLHERQDPNEPWQGSSQKRNEIVYPGETLELRGKFGKLSGLTVICIVFEEVRESGENRRWKGFAQYIFTEKFERFFQSGFEPEMQLVHRTEKLTMPHEASTCDAVDWWSKLPTVSTGKPASKSSN